MTGHPFTPDAVYDAAVHGPFQPGQQPDLDAAALVSGYLTCAACGVLPVTHTRNRYYNDLPNTEYDNALVLSLSGGYGMFFDDNDQGPRRVALCHDCAHALCDANPWLSTLLEPARSHSHTTAYAAAHPGHNGWDYDTRSQRAQEAQQS